MLVYRQLKLRRRLVTVATERRADEKMPMFTEHGRTLESSPANTPNTNNNTQAPEVKLDYYEEVYRRGYVQIEPELIRIGIHLIFVVLAMIAGRFFLPLIKTLIKTTLG